MPWWLPALTFLAGLALGVSAFAVSPPQAPDGSAAAPRPTASAAPTPAPTGNPPSVTAPCLAVADHAEEMLQELNRAVVAIRDLDAAELSGIVRRLGTMQPRLQESTAACRRATPAAGSTG